jgi:hypothetical protein
MYARWTHTGCMCLVVALILGIMTSASQGTESVTITVLTLDNRPPNTLLLQQLAAVAGVDLVLESDPEAASWADCVSLNAAAAGSLVGSRTADPWLLKPPKVRPDALIHFAVPRVEPTVVDKEVMDEYRRVREALADPALQREMIEAIAGRASIPEDEYMAAYVDRMRGWLDFLSRAGYDPDRLLVTLDDNRPGPLSDGLKSLLETYSRHVQDGTDEGMMLLLARALRERQISAPVTCAITWTHPGDLVAVQPLESGFVVENALAMSRWLGLRITPRGDLTEQWRPVLWIHGPYADAATRADLVRGKCAELGDRGCIVADIARTSGGDPVLIDTWRQGATPDGLIGYLGWNTSSNALGSAFALWAAIDFAYEHGADPEGVRAASETFLWARLLDDYFYQSVARAERRDLLAAEGGDIWNLTAEERAREEGAIAARLTELWRELGEDLAIPLRIVDPLGHTGIVVELPWSRFFEIALYPTDDRGILPVIRPHSPS